MRAALLFVFPLAGGCAVPERDNPADPANRPVAALEIVDRGISRAADGSCAVEVGAGEPWQPVVSAGRGRCLALDARSSSSPRGELEEGRFEVLTADSATSVGALAVAGTGRLLAIVQPSLLRELPVNEPVIVRVTVKNAYGRSTADVPFQVQNASPIVEPPPLASFPLHGMPWQPIDTPASAELSTTCSDPDGDPIDSWMWSPGPSVIAACGTEPSCAITIPTSVAARHRVSVRCSDGEAQSGPGTFLLDVRAPSAWTTREAGTSFTSGSLLDPDAREVPGAPVYATASVPGSEARVASLAGTTLRLIDASTGAVLSSVSASNVRAIASAPDGSAIWTIGSAFVPGGVTEMDLPMTRFAVSGTSLGSAVTVGSVAGSPFVPALATFDAGGSLWAAGFGGGVVALASSTAILDTLPLDARVVTALAARPGTSEVWMVLRDASGSRLQVAHRQGDTVTLGEEWPLESAAGEPLLGATGLAWMDPDHFWTAVPALGVVLANATRLPEGFAAAIEVQVPGVLDAAYLLLDDSSGAVAVRTSSGDRLHRVDPSGTVTTWEGSAFTPHTFDQRGLLWGAGLNSSGAEVLRGGRGDASGVIARVPFTSAARPVAIAPGGGLWLAEAIPSSLVRLSEDGRTLDRITHFSVSGGQQPIGDVRALALAPEHGSLWLARQTDLANQQVLRVDLRPAQRIDGTTAPATPLGTFARGAFPAFFPSTLFGAAAQAAEPALWTLRIPAAGTTPAVVRFTDIAEAQPYVIPAVEAAATIHAATSPGQDEVCLVTQQFNSGSGTWTVRVRRVTPQGQTLWRSYSRSLSNTAPPVTAVAASSRPEICWVATMTGTLTPSGIAIDGWNSSGTSVRPLTAAYGSLAAGTTFVDGIRADGATHLWLRMENPSGDASLLRLDWSGSNWVPRVVPDTGVFFAP